MLLTDIKNKLEEIDPRVFYGVVDKEIAKHDWNYIVFNRVKLKETQNKTGYSDAFDVHIIRENFIPDGLAEQVINKLREINGVRTTSEDGEYNYAEKPSTNAVVEMLSLHFIRARKNV